MDVSLINDGPVTLIVESNSVARREDEPSLLLWF